MEDEDIATIHMLFQHLGTENFDLEAILVIASKLMKAYPPDRLLWNNKDCGLEADSPFINESLQIDTKFEKISKTSNEYIRFEVPVWQKAKKILSPGNIAMVGVSITAAYLLYSSFATN